MNWAAYIGLFGVSTIKFLFAPFGGPKLGLTYIETYVSCIAGAILCATIIYFSSEFFLHRAHKKRVTAYREALAAGVTPKQKKKFTKANKFIVRIKRKLGIIGISFYAPLFLSIPIGTIITAKFYGKHKKTYPMILLGIAINGGLTTGLSYGIAYLF